MPLPSTNSAYDEVAASGEFPEDLLDLYRTSVDEGGPRPKSPFYSQISSAIQVAMEAVMTGCSYG